MIVVQDIQNRCFCRLDLSGHACDVLSGTFEGDLYLLDIGGQQGEGGESSRSDGEALSGCGGGVAERVENIGALADLRLQLAHLGIASGVVGNGAVSVGCEGDAEGAEHAHCSDCDSVEALRQGGCGHHILHVKADGEEVRKHDCANYCDNRDGGGYHTEADTVDDDGGGTGLGGLCQLLRRLIGVRSVVFGRLADNHSGDESCDYRAAEVPPVVVAGAEHQGQDAEGGDTAEDGGHIGTEAHALEQLSHACAFLGAHGEDADDREHHAHCRDEHRGDDGLGLHGGTCHIECGGAEGHGGEDGAAVALIEVCAHAGHVTHIVAHVVRYGCGVAGVVLGKIGFDFTYYIGSYVGGLGIDTAAHTGEEGLGGCTHSEGQHGGGDYHELLCLGGLYDAGVKHYVPKGNVQQTESHDGEAHDGS